MHTNLETTSALRRKKHGKFKRHPDHWTRNTFATFDQSIKGYKGFTSKGRRRVHPCPTVQSPPKRKSFSSKMLLFSPKHRCEAHKTHAARLGEQMLSGAAHPLPWPSLRTPAFPQERMGRKMRSKLLLQGQILI